MSTGSGTAPLEDAVSEGLLPRNPAAAVKRPATPKSAAGKVWSADQARRFLTSVAADRLEVLWRLELSTGLRRAEAAGLRWSDVDLDAGALSVRVQRTTEGYAVVEREPKTGAGRRLVPLDADVVASLRAWRKRQVEERLAYGPAHEHTGLVFTREDGAGYHPQRLSVMFAACARRPVSSRSASTTSATRRQLTSSSASSGQYRTGSDTRATLT